MKFLKILATIFLVLSVTVLVLVFVSVLLVKFGGGLPFGQRLKEKLIHYPLFVFFANLNEPGDARYMYLDSSKELSVELMFLRNSRPNGNVEKWINQMMLSTLGKSVKISESKAVFEEKDEYSDDDLNAIRSGLAGRFDTEGRLFIVYLTKYQKDPSNIGIAMHRDAIFIFNDTLNELSEDKTTLEKLEKSTIMHEWGHLLGIEHVDDPDCVISGLVEVTDNHFLGAGQIPVEYCYSRSQENPRVRLGG